MGDDPATEWAEWWWSTSIIGTASARHAWENVDGSRHAGIRFDPEAVICLGSSCTWDASDFAPDVEFTEADALMIGAELGYSGDADSLVVHADWLMSQGSAEGLEVAAWLSDRDLP